MHCANTLSANGHRLRRGEVEFVKLSKRCYDILTSPWSSVGHEISNEQARLRLGIKLGFLFPSLGLWQEFNKTTKWNQLSCEVSLFESAVVIRITIPHSDVVCHREILDSQRPVDIWESSLKQAAPCTFNNMSNLSLGNSVIDWLLRGRCVMVDSVIIACFSKLRRSICVDTPNAYGSAKLRKGAICLIRTFVKSGVTPSIL